jgi:hypothetical protein
MTGNIRFAVWVHRRGGSIFGESSRPVNQDGSILTFNDERSARAECDRLIARSQDPYSRYTVEKDMAPHYPSTHSDLGRRLAKLTVDQHPFGRHRASLSDKQNG